MTFVRNTLSLLATTAFIAPIRLLTVIVLARLLEPDALGTYTVTITFSTISMLLVQLGLPSSAIYRIRRLAHAPAQVAGSVLLTGTALGAVASLLLLIVEPSISARIFQGEPAQSYKLGIAIAFFQLLGTSFVGVARGIDRFDAANLYRVLISVGQLAGLLVFLGLLDGGLFEALLVTAIVHSLSTAHLIGSVIRTVGIGFADWRAQLGPSLRYGAKSHAQSLAGNLHEQIDIFMLAYLIADPGRIAIYSVAVGVITRMKLVPAALADALFPEIAGRSPDEAALLAAKTVRHSFVGVLVIAAGIALLAPVVVPLAFGDPYGDSVPILLLLLPGMVMLTNFLLLGRFFMAIDRQQVSIGTQVAAVLVNVSINALLIPTYGIAGAAIASVISYSLEFVVLTTLFVRSTGASLSTLFLFDRSDFRLYTSWLRRLRGRSFRSR